MFIILNFLHHCRSKVIVGDIYDKCKFMYVTKTIDLIIFGSYEISSFSTSLSSLIVVFYLLLLILPFSSLICSFFTNKKY